MTTYQCTEHERRQRTLAIHLCMYLSNKIVRVVGSLVSVGEHEASCSFREHLRAVLN